MDAPTDAQIPTAELEADLLLDAARLVALNGFAHECRLLPFLSPDYAREEDFLVATRHLTYGRHKRTRLMSVSHRGDSARVRSLLRVGAEVGAGDVDGSTALHWAGEGGSAVVAAQLLDKGADVDARDKRQQTPLMYASWQGRLAVVEVLLARGAGIGARDVDGN
jgi:ankyrin repeat protein